MDSQSEIWSSAVSVSNGVEISRTDLRSYRPVTLGNKLEVLLVSDPKTDKAAAAMDVYVGHFSDPHDVPGLAHFLEHMLFLGTEKYPDENSYSAFLNEHGGSSNASTDMENTNYYFNVGYDHLERALDMFAQFFVCPLFTPGATDRELIAVDSEHSKNLQDDMWRMFQLEKSTSNPDHPYHKFATGDSKTLRDVPVAKGIDVRSRLLEFHEQYYSANQMKLVVVGRDSLDQLQAWVEKYFSDVQNTGIGIPTYGPMATTPFSENEIGRRIDVVPVKELRSIELTWALDSMLQKYKRAPHRYLGHLLGHEGKGSIISLLKEKGWVNSLSAGLSHNTSTFSTFKISVECTSEGIQHVDDIIGTIFRYMEIISKNDYGGVEKWRWEEVAQQSANLVRFRSLTDAAQFASAIARKLHTLPYNHVVTSSLIRVYDRVAIIDMLKQLSPERVQVMVANDAFGNEPMDSFLEEAWYKTKYRVNKFDPCTLSKWQSVEVEAGDLHLPSRNEFIPNDFKLQPFVTPVPVATERVVSKMQHKMPPLLLDALTSVSQTMSFDIEKPGNGKQKRSYKDRNSLTVWTSPGDEDMDIWRPPVLICADDPVGLVWFKQDIAFKRPKATVSVSISRPLVYDPRFEILSELYALLVRDILDEYTYPAEISGLMYNFQRSSTGSAGVSMVVGGFTQKLSCLLERIIDVVCNPSLFTERSFQRFKEKLKQSYRNFEKNQPYMHVLYTCNVLLNFPTWHVDEKLAVFDSITLADVVAHATEMLENCWLETLVTGNVLQEDAIRYAQLVAAKIAEQTGKSEQLCMDPCCLTRVVALKERTESYYWMKGRDPENVNSAIEVNFQIGPDDPSVKARLQLLAQIAQEPCYNNLRTEKQLGYIVFCGVRNDQGIIGLRFIIQSSRADPIELDDHVEQFLVLLDRIIIDMDAKSLQQNIDAALDLTLEKDKTLYTNAKRWEQEIADGFYKFSRDVECAAYMTNISKQELLAFFQTHIKKDGALRKKLVAGTFGSSHHASFETHITAPPAANATTKLSEALRTRGEPKAVQISSIQQFRASNALYPVQSRVPRNKL
mmetsp:Transcript_23631/g.37719  ORF Transcript_23631/g.37719 Transcript_23631/m.37719 type:complete len:1069 (+) Transcript_23631:271-3477(+)|eukprot:CAMPEP_0203763060 /NCGR_PEP_ID=MMETSP0098-20131031/15769_1 /ASSEMBLY_ACC=CAM_ASM_000208 /TAXON_ID=96639 /ORGANISM=" , Strain NY0313808BC1" /LENGTH=1068 /DNA_ID=CAMNT_0050657663 /DNA_START=213 /DNA_END=3419 /DNA_ORIENTATION=+